MIAKNLSKVDKFYANINKGITVQERIEYCINLIYRTQGYMSRNQDNMSHQIKETSNEILSAAQLEIKELSEKNKINISDYKKSSDKKRFYLNFDL